MTVRFFDWKLPQLWWVNIFELFHPTISILSSCSTLRKWYFKIIWSYNIHFILLFNFDEIIFLNYFVLQYPCYFYNFMIRFWNFYKCSNLQTECGECKSKMEFSFSFFQTKFSKVSTNQNKNSDESQTSQSKYYRNGYVPTFMKTVSSGDTFQKHSFCNYVHSFFIIDMGNKDTCMLHNIRHIIFRTSNTCWMNSPAWTVAWAGGYYLDFWMILLDCF